MSKFRNMYTFFWSCVRYTTKIFHLPLKKIYIFFSYYYYYLFNICLKINFFVFFSLCLIHFFIFYMSSRYMYCLHHIVHDFAVGCILLIYILFFSRIYIKQATVGTLTVVYSFYDHLLDCLKFIYGFIFIFFYTVFFFVVFYLFIYFCFFFFFFNGKSSDVVFYSGRKLVTRKYSWNVYNNGGRISLLRRKRKCNIVRWILRD